MRNGAAAMCSLTTSACDDTYSAFYDGLYSGALSPVPAAAATSHVAELLVYLSAVITLLTTFPRLLYHTPFIHSVVSYFYSLMPSILATPLLPLFTVTAQFYQ